MSRNTLFASAIVCFALSSGCASLHTSFSASLHTSLKELEARDQIAEAHREEIVGNSHQSYLPKLVSFAKTLGVTVVYQPTAELEGVKYFGFYEQSKKLITIATKNIRDSAVSASPNVLVSTLAHEIGHVLQPAHLAHNDNHNQVFAEAISYGFCKRIGLKDWRYSFWYLKHYSARYEVLVKFEKEIDAAIDLLVASTR